MHEQWKHNIDEFLSLTRKHQVKMLMVGGGAVNFHGYQRHSADVDFWIETSTENLQKLINVLLDMGYEIREFPEDVKNQKSNISIKFSPVDIDLELITKFEIGKSFEEAYNESEEVEINKGKLLKWNVLNFEDLIESKRRAGRPKDLLDIQQLIEIRKFRD